MSTLTHEKLIAGHKDLLAVERIYTENFPEEERVPFECFVKPATREPDKYDLRAWYEDEKLVAFSYYIVGEEAAFGHYLAKDKQSTSKGVGTRIFDCYLEELMRRGKIFYCSAEKPEDPDSPTDFKAWRLKQWTRDPMRATGLGCSLNGVELLLLSTEHLYSKEKRVKGAEFLAKINKMRRGRLDAKVCTRCAGKGVIRTLRSLFFKKDVCPHCRGMGIERK